MGNNVVLGGGGFHHISISVKDFDASVKFYTEVLGFRQTAVWGNDDKKRLCWIQVIALVLKFSVEKLPFQNLRGTLHILPCVLQIPKELSKMRKPQALKLQRNHLTLIYPTVRTHRCKDSIFQRP